MNGRAQRVAVNGAASCWWRVTSGAPQGSVLGSVLFNISINGESLQRDLDWKINNSIKVKGKCCVLHLGEVMPAMSTAWDTSDQRAAQQKGTDAGRFRLDIRKSFFNCEGCEALEEAS